MISSELYIQISDLIDSSLRKEDKISSIFDRIQEDLDNSEISSDDLSRIELENYLNSTEEVLERKHSYYAEEMQNFVRELQKYVENEYGSVNEFFYNNTIKVKSAFAEISEMVGYPISSEYIEVEDELLSHFYYCRMGASGLAAAKIAGAKGYDIVYNLGYYGTTTGYGYEAYLADAVACALEIGDGVNHYAKVNFFPGTVTEATAAGIEESSILDVTDLQYLCDQFPQLDSSSYPFNGMFMDLEPTAEIKTAFPLWMNLTENQKDILIGLDFSKEVDYILPYDPDTRFYGGLEPHFVGTFISEDSYYQEGNPEHITEIIIPGIAISSTGDTVSGGSPYMASEINTLWVGRKKFLFPVESSTLWVACAEMLPDLISS